MRRTLAATALFALATPLFAADFDRHLYRLDQDTGSLTGHDEVTIEGEFNFSGLADPCVGPMVWVGGKPAQVLKRSETAVTFLTPAYTVGTFDVTVDTCGARGVLQNAFTYQAPYERVLLPVYQSSDVAGANGSLWRTELSGFVNGQVCFTAHPEAPTSPMPGLLACTDHGNGPFEPVVDSDQRVPGRLVYAVGPAVKERLSLNLRVRDVSRQAESFGTEVPVVFEDDAYGPYDTFVLPNVPLTSRYRAKLRLYQLDGGGGSVNLFFRSEQDLLLYRQVTLSPAAEPNAFTLYPGYAELDLDQLAELAGHAHTDIVIGVPEGRFWGFVSVTNNDTQQITTVTP